MLTPFERGFIAHLIADWLLQNDWMAKNKTSLRHPAAWTHAAIYAVLLTVALGWQAGLVLGVLHLLVDTRVPRRWWQDVFRQTTEGPLAVIVAVGVDQAIHVIAIAAWLIIAPQ